MEKIMSKTDDTSNITTFEHHDTLADHELDAVTGGYVPTSDLKTDRRIS